MRFSSVSFIMSLEREKTVDIIIREAFHMKHRRKALALLAALLPLSLAACGNGNPSADTKSAKEEASSESSSTDASNGNEGGSSADLKGIFQKLSGAVKVGSDSSLKLEPTNDPSLTGSVDGSIKNATGETVSADIGTVSVTLDSGGSWTLGADSYVTEFSGSAANVISSGHAFCTSTAWR